MMAEQNVLAAAVQVLWAAEKVDNCLAEFEKEPATCFEFEMAEADAMQQLGKAVEDAGIAWRDPAVRERLRTQGLP